MGVQGIECGACCLYRVHGVCAMGVQWVCRVPSVACVQWPCNRSAIGVQWACRALSVVRVVCILCVVCVQWVCKRRVWHQV